MRSSANFGFRILLLVLTNLLLHSAVAAETPPTSPQTTNGQNGSPNLVSPYGGGMDKNYALGAAVAGGAFVSALENIVPPVNLKSYHRINQDFKANPRLNDQDLGFTRLFLNADFARLQKNLPDLLHHLDKIYFYVILLDTQFRTSKHLNLQAYSADYSSLVNDYNISVQRYEGSRTAFGYTGGLGVAANVGLNFNIRSQINAYAKEVAYLKRQLRLLKSGKLSDLEKLDTLSRVEAFGELSKKTLGLIVSVLNNRPQISFVTSYRYVNNLGESFSFGLSGSFVVPNTHLIQLLSLQSEWFHSREFLTDYYTQRGELGLRQAAALRPGIALMWQDILPRVRSKQKGDLTEYYVERWHWQLGVEYIGNNAIDRGDSLSGFIRYRPNQHYEISILGGSQPEIGQYFGVQFGYSWGQ